MGRLFPRLICTKNSERFDNDHKVYIEKQVNIMSTASLSNHKDIFDDEITLDEVTIAVKSLRRNKVTDIDTISNEHILYGGTTLWSHITKLFNLFMVCEHIPDNAKQGVIITLPKPGKTHYNKLLF